MANIALLELEAGGLHYPFFSGFGHSVKIWSVLKLKLLTNNKGNIWINCRKHLFRREVETNGIEEAIYGADAVVMVVPSHTIRDTSKKTWGYIKDGTVVVYCQRV